MKQNEHHLNILSLLKFYYYETPNTKHRYCYRLRQIHGLGVGKIFIILASVFFSAQLSGQNNIGLFNITTRSEIGFSQEQSDKLDTMITNPIYLDYFFVTVNELAQVQVNGNVSVNFPDKQDIEIFLGKNIRYKSEYEYSYFGDFDPCDPQRMGYMQLISNNGNVFGQFNIENEIYELQDFGGRKNVLFKINPSIYTEAECGNGYDSSQQQMIKNINHYDEESNINFRSGGCNIRVLVLYTTKAKDYGNPHNSARLFIQQTNQIFINSEVKHHFTLTATEEVVGFEEYQTSEETRNKLRINPLANELRDLHQADLVVLLTYGKWYENGGRTIGDAFLDQWGIKEYGYALTEIDAGGGIYTFSHEIAHAFGCKHDNDDRGEQQNFVYDARGHNFYTYFWGIFNKTPRRTIMSISQYYGNSRIEHFSNPNVEFKKVPTGVSDERDNAKQLTMEGCNVAVYRPFVPPLNVKITGPNVGDNFATYTWCVDINGCTNLTSIVWEYSLDGINYFPWPIDVLCVTNSLPFNESLWIRVIVTCDGDDATAYHFVKNRNEDPCNWENLQLSKPALSNERFQQNIDNSNFYAFPNPGDNTLNIAFHLIEDATVVVHLVDLSGKTVKEFIFPEFLWGEDIKSMDISDLQKGYYYLQCKIGKELITKSYIKL